MAVIVNKLTYLSNEPVHKYHFLAITGCGCGKPGWCGGGGQLDGGGGDVEYWD